MANASDGKANSIAMSSQQPFDTPGETISINQDQNAISGDSGMLEEQQSGSAARIMTRNQLSSIALNASVFLAALDNTIISTALPTVASELNIGRGYTWITGAYLLSTAAAVPVITKLSDIWGRKPIMLASVALFFLSSMTCALSINGAMLIAGRALQGIGGGGCLAMAGVIPSDQFSERERSMYYTVQTVIWSVASASGPPLGGVFAQEASWRWCFWINLPITGITFIALLLCLDVHNPRTRLMDGLRALDWAGIVCILGFVLMFLFALEFGGQVFPWNSSTIICLLVFSVVMAALFAVSESKFAEHPILPPEVAKNRSNVASIIVGSSQTFVGMGVAFFVPLFLQTAKEATPLRSGLYYLPYTVADAASAILVGIYITKTGNFVTIIWAGAALITVSTSLLLLLHASSTIGFCIGLLVISGFAIGTLFQPILLSVHASTEQHNVAMATAAVGSARTIAGTISITLGGVLFQNGMARQRTTLEAAGVSDTLIQRYSGADATTNVIHLRNITNPTVRRALEVAFARSIHDIWIMCACVMATGVIASFFVKGKSLKTDHVKTETGIKPKG